MPNSPMVASSQEPLSLDSVVLIPTTMATLTSTPSLNITLPGDMVFNAGHQLSIIVYRFESNDKNQSSVTNSRGAFCYCSRSILMVISAIGNTTVLSLLVKRRMRTPSRLDIMLTHLAIADLMVSYFRDVLFNNFHRNGKHSSNR